MILLQEPSVSEVSDCPYIVGNESQNLHFYAQWVEQDEYDKLLSTGWRRFAQYYFRPKCRFCMACKPIRIPVNKVLYSKSQRKLNRKNSDIRVEFNEKKYSEDIFNIYKKHSKRFGQVSTEKEFLEAHYTDTCESLQSEYYFEDQIIAIGFLDKSCNALSSSYFFYDTDYMHLSLGFYSIAKEMEHTKFLGLEYYYLGYYIKENHFMAYKNKFFPHEIMNWKTGEWEVKTK